MKLSLLFILLMALIACDIQPPQYEGELSDADNNTLPLEVQPPDDTASICDEDLLWFEQTLWQPVILTTCIDCHHAAGLAAATSLVLDPSSSLNSFSRLATYSSDNQQAQWLLAKPSGQMIHGGGEVFTADSAEYQALADWLARQDELGSCQQVTKNIWQGVNLLTSQQTLRKASLLMAGRLPTNAEKTQLQQEGDDSLKQMIRQFMAGDKFNSFVEEGANSQFLTDKWNNQRTPGLDLMYAGGRFPNIESRLGPLQVAVDNAADDDARLLAQQAFGEAWLNTNYGLAKAPLKLVSSIVAAEGAYSEILTANYIMVNPYTNDVYQTGLSFANNNDKDAWQAGRITAGYLNGDIPHAGILTDTMWLARYPSTDTNRNRARARWAYYFFLGVDIEGTATRPTDAAALMDTNNPTLNNSACTVCHIVMDPVAGAFQNFGDGGHYRDSWGGNESLPGSYKNSDLFTLGDHWYSDMLAPGFNSTTMASSNNDASLRWLASAMAADNRFASGTVKFWWPAMYGSELLLVPTAIDDLNYEQQLAAYNAQQSLIESLAEKFRLGTAGTGVNGTLNLKDLLVEMILAEPFRALSIDEGSEVLIPEISTMGVGQLLTPEQLDRKLEALVGKRWQHIWDDDNIQLLRDYYGLFGGIDSDSVKERATQLNTLMSAVAGRMSQELPCRLVIDEFEQDQAQRLLFNAVDISDTPTSNNTAIREQINQLIDRLWGSQLHTDLATEQEQAYQLFNAVWQDRVANAPSIWLYHNDETAGPNAGDDDEFCVLDWDNDQALRYDEHHTIRSWMALITYLLSDFSILYE
ncbi:MAG: hypothetical protein ACI9OH_001887 [Oleispira sp.]|jgi:hypothetical protein